MQHHITTVSVCFQADLRKDQPRRYTYKVPEALSPSLGDLAVVFVRERYECVSIVGINPPLDPAAKFAYKSILAIVDIVTKHPIPNEPICDTTYDEQDFNTKGPNPY